MATPNGSDDSFWARPGSPEARRHEATEPSAPEAPASPRHAEAPTPAAPASSPMPMGQPSATPPPVDSSPGPVPWPGVPQQPVPPSRDPYASAPYAARPYQQPYPQQGPPQWQYQGAPQWQQPTSNNTGRGCLVLLAVLVITALVGLWQFGRIVDQMGGFEMPEDDPTPHTVKLVVTTTVKSDVNWSVGAMSGTRTTSSSFTKTVETNGKRVVSLSVAPDPTTSAKVSCEIFVDGTSIDKATSDGSGGLASCTGRTA